MPPIPLLEFLVLLAPAPAATPKDTSTRGMMVVSPITVDDYDVEALDFDELEKRLIYSPATKKLYYCYNKTFILLSVDQQNRLDDIERRLAALEGA